MKAGYSRTTLSIILEESAKELAFNLNGDSNISTRMSLIQKMKPRNQKKHS